MERCVVDGCANPPLYRLSFQYRVSGRIEIEHLAVCKHILHMVRPCISGMPVSASYLSSRTTAPEALRTIEERVSSMTEREKGYLGKHMPLRRNA